MWRSAVSIDRRQRSFYLGGSGYGPGLAALRCLFNAGWGLARASSSSWGRWGSARRGWAAPLDTKTSCSFILRHSDRGPILVTWTLTDCVTCLHSDWQMLPHWRWTRPTWCKVECDPTVSSGRWKLTGFKCSKTPFGFFMCIKCEWLLYILELCVFCKKFDVQFWSYFLWQKCIKWKPLIVLNCSLMLEFLFF